MLKKRRIKIELQSDLCAGSGYSFAGIIDSDVCYDDCGIPFLPARRLKGCMRETAQTTLYALLSEEDISAIFGVRGQKAATGIFVSDARICNYETFYHELKECMANDKMKGIITPQKVLDTYTTVKAQTQIDDSGVADDSTLRFTRTVNQKNSLTKEDIIFLADIIYEEAYETKLEWILKATRNIGLHRNRGLGAVKIDWDGNGELLCEQSNPKIETSEKTAAISYKIKNLEPLMLASNDRGSSVSYISGQSVVGVMAARYLKKYGQADEVFSDLFLNGTVKFTNATLCVGGDTFYPAPAYLAKLKLYKHIVNTYISDSALPDDIQNKEEYSPAGGNQPKKLKGKYVYMESEQACAVKDVKRTLVYHNRINDMDESGNHLYNQEALAAGQTFCGEVFLPEKYLELVKDLLSEKIAWFGRSRTAQYGMCEITDVKDVAEPVLTFHAKKGDTILVVLLSDGIFIQDDEGERGHADYTVYIDELLPIVASSLAEKGKLQYFDDSDVSEHGNQGNSYIPSMITTKEVHGYQSMWNLRRQPVPAVCAGSVFSFRVEDDVKISRNFIGERNMEGYGQIRLVNLNEMKYYPLTEAKLAFEKKGTEIQKSQEVIRFIQDILQDELYQEVKKNFMEKIRTLNFKSAALLGRVTLMLKESQEKQKEDEAEAFVDFSKRILSVKTKSEREKMCREILEKLGDKDKSKDGNIISYHLNAGKIEEYINEDSRYALLLENSLHVSEEEILKNLQKKWADMLMTALSDMKYEMKHQEEKAL